MKVEEYLNLAKGFADTGGTIGLQRGSIYVQVGIGYALVTISTNLQRLVDHLLKSPGQRF